MESHVQDLARGAILPILCSAWRDASRQGLELGGGEDKGSGFQKSLCLPRQW